MIYLITGGASFIGIALTKLLVENNHTVFIVCRECSKNREKIPQSEKVNVIFYKGLEDISLLKEKIACADVFIHLAWAGTSHEGRLDKELQDNNIKYSLEAIDIAHKLGCNLFVDAGSQAEYGYVENLITENTPCNPQNEYGRAKLEFSKMAAQKCRTLKMKHIHLRIMSIYGDTDHSWTLVMSSIRKMLNNESIELSSCSQSWNFVYIKDAVRQIYLLCQYALNKPDYSTDIFHIGSKDTRPLKEFVYEMYRLTGSQSKLLFGEYTPPNVVSLNPSMRKTEEATNGFISEYSFSDIVKLIITNYNRGYYEKSK